MRDLGAVESDLFKIVLDGREVIGDIWETNAALKEIDDDHKADDERTRWEVVCEYLNDLAGGEPFAKRSLAEKFYRSVVSAMWEAVEVEKKRLGNSAGLPTGMAADPTPETSANGSGEPGLATSTAATPSEPSGLETSPAGS